jgi:sugar lactone lactonase YvrE
MTEEAYCVLDCKNHLGEGALWDDRDGVLWWVDVPMPSMLHRLDPATSRHDEWAMPEMIMSLAVRESGGLLIASHHGLNTFEPAEGRLVRVLEPEADKPRNRSNDGGTDPRGRFWFGTMQNNLAEDASAIPITESSGAIYRIDPNLTVTRMAEEIGIANTFAWSPDGTRLYFADTLTGWIFVYDFDLEAGTLGERRNFARADNLGYPDGSTIDAEGYLWNARWGGSCVARFAPDGTIDRIVKVPADKVTSCAFGGPDLDTLYITSARYEATEDDQLRQPQAGGLFAVSPGIKGLPRPRFAG